MDALVFYAALVVSVATVSSRRQAGLWMLGLLPSSWLFVATRVAVPSPFGGCCSGARSQSLPTLVLLWPALLGASLLAGYGPGRAFLGYCAGGCAPLVAMYGLVFLMFSLG